MLARLRPGKLSLLAKFAIIGAIPTLVLSVMLGKTLQASISRRAMNQVRDEAVLFSNLAVEPLVSENGVRHALSTVEASQVRAAIGRDMQLHSRVAGVRIWRFDGNAAFSTGNIRGAAKVRNS